MATNPSLQENCVSYSQFVATIEAVLSLIREILSSMIGISIRKILVPCPRALQNQFELRKFRFPL